MPEEALQMIGAGIAVFFIMCGLAVMSLAGVGGL
jgi:hypothetical protein